MKTLKSYYAHNRLPNTVSTTSEIAFSRFAYGYHNANQRTRASMVDGCYWVDLVGINPFHFSSKYQDDETDLLCYGYRITTRGRTVAE
jgi:hypothetical protein